MPTARTAKADWRLRLELLGIGVVAVSVILAILAVAQVQHEFRFAFRTGLPGTGATTLTVPKGSHVSISFASGDGTAAEFQLIDGGLNWVYSDDAPNASYSFVANDPPYYIGAVADTTDTVYAWGTYSTPLL